MSNNTEPQNNGGTIDYLEYLNLPKQQYDESIIPDNAATFEEIERESPNDSDKLQDGDNNFSNTLPGEQEPKKEIPKNEGERPNNSNTTTAEEANHEAEMVTITVDFSIKQICSLISQEETEDTREKDLKNLQKLWARYFEQSGKKVPLWLLMSISHVAIYGPEIGLAIYTRMKKEEQKRKIKEENARKIALQNQIRSEKEAKKNEKTTENNEKTTRKTENEEPKEQIPTYNIKGIEQVKVETGLIVDRVPDEEMKFLTKDQYNGRLCKTCGKGLKGPNQKRFCSHKCSATFINLERNEK
jgi:leucyl aminopeptidase